MSRLRIWTAALLWALAPAAQGAAAETPQAPGGVLPYDFHLSSAAVAKACADAKAGADARLALLGAAAPREGSAFSAASFKDSFVAFSDILSDLSDETSVGIFLGQVAVDKPVRDAGVACDTEISQFLVDVYTREPIYKLLKAAAAAFSSATAKPQPLKGEDERLVEKTLLEFKRNGLELAPEDRAKVRELKQRIVALQNDFSKNLAEEKTTLAFTKAQLAGLPDDFVARLAKDGDKYKVSLDYPDYFPFVENAKDPSARRAMESKFNSRGGAANARLLAEAIRLRAEAAKLLGYPDYATYVLEDRMAKKPEAVLTFLDRVKIRLDEKAFPELEVLKQLKKEEEGDKSDGVFHAWDWRYYHNKLMKTRYQVDEQAIKEYFPVDVVTAGLLDVYQTLLGLKFEEVRPSGAWQEDVKLYRVTDASATAAGAIGYFFMDLFPREGKYKHAAAFTLIPGRLLPDGSYQKPVSAIVANFNKPNAAQPSLLTHEEVETFFHEFGHIMHQVLTKAKYERFSGSNVAQDFVEAPSQMFEEWVWQGDVLRRLSGHYQDRSRKLPDDLLKKMIAAKNVDSGLIHLRQDFFATVDMTYHTQLVGDLNETYGRLQEEIALIPMTPGTIPEASFGHLMSGYDAGYYGYLWSKVYAEDMFSRFEKGGVLNPELGREYRRKILERGGSAEEGISLRSFLGREPNEDAFLRSIGLELRGPSAANPPGLRR